ncbi:glucosylltransferase family 4 [Sporothrix schenckii 1099-18]|uniref:Glucosylltransferase family 4 n=1 Tax=Sporothrix schenckii 1099-18 TaxID=1397361 RepID=A0A0F2MF83_SPOSC|nr:glucosylltransferase family 4 [Sporothrix schenckii 1099-18]KJR88358.1 glucosylltransferase family 4 [Sporothrix schenckii 1099-18]
MVEDTATTTLSAAAQGPAHDLSVFPERLRGKRILLCTESFGPVNGVSRTTLMLVNHLRAHGANVGVVAPHNHTKVNTFVPTVVPETASTDDVPVNPEIRIHGYPLPFNPELSIVYPVRLSALCARTFNGHKPDLIYLASPASLGFQVMLQVRQQPTENQIPVLANFQTDLSGYCAILFPAPFSDFAVYCFAQVEGFLFRHPSVKTIFYPSRFVRRYLEKNRVAPEKMQLLRRGVNTDMFNPTRRNEVLRQTLAPNGEIILVCVARIAGEKGFDFLAAVATELDRRGLAFKLYIVGGNRNTAVEDEVKDLFSELIQKGKVVFAGFQVGETLAESYASADMFLHCSITETFGLVVLESMASGVPVIARDEGGPSDIVDHGNTGFLVPPADLESFVSKVLLLAGDSDLRSKMGGDARRQACDATWDKINNTVAWRMLDAIEQRDAALKEAQFEGFEEDPQESAREREPLLGYPSGTKLTAAEMAAARKKLQPPSSWQAWAQSIDTSLVDARLTAGLGIILGFWGIVGVYLIFIKAALWFKGRVRVGV